MEWKVHWLGDQESEKFQTDQLEHGGSSPGSNGLRWWWW